MTPKPTQGGVTLSEHANQKFTARLGEFTFKTIDEALNAVINWGDGTHSTGKLVGSYATGEYYVQGTHTYAKTGTYQVGVKVYAHLIGSPIQPTNPVAQFTSVIKASVLKPTNGGLNLLEVANSSFTTTLGEFTFRTVDQSIKADINWGDGTHSTGVLIGSYATGEYYVQGTHTYSHTGTYAVQVNVLVGLIGSSVPPVAVQSFISVMKVVGND